MKSIFRNHRKILLLIGSIVLTPFCLNAWTVQVLDPASTTSGNNIPGNTTGRTSFNTFVNYIKATESILTSGLLQSYKLGDSDAVIVNLCNSSYGDTELNILKQLLESNTRVLVFGEHSGWDESGKQLASLVGGTYSSNGEPNQNIVSGAYPIITDGISNVYLNAVGKISHDGSKGISLTDDDGVTLWGANYNFLLFMDVDAFSDSIKNAENMQFAQNIAVWLSGSGANIPEPSTYGLIAGFFLLGGSIIRRRR